MNVSDRTVVEGRPGAEPGGRASDPARRDAGGPGHRRGLGVGRRTPATGPSSASTPDKHVARRRPDLEVGTSPSGVAVGEGSVWVTVAEDNKLVRVEP